MPLEPAPSGSGVPTVRRASLPSNVARPVASSPPSVSPGRLTCDGSPSAPPDDRPTGATRAPASRRRALLPRRLPYRRARAARLHRVAQVDAARGPSTSPRRASPSSCPGCPGTARAGRTWRSPGGRTGTPRSTARFSSLRERCDQVFVMGLSMGGSLAAAPGREPPRRGRRARAREPRGALRAQGPPRCCRCVRHVVKAFPGITNDIKKPGQDEGGYLKLPLQLRLLAAAGLGADQGRHRPDHRAGAAPALPRGPRRRAEQLGLDPGPRAVARTRPRCGSRTATTSPRSTTTPR